MVREHDAGPWLEEFLRNKGWATISPEVERKEYDKNAAAYLINLLRERRSLRDDIVVIDAGADKKIGLNQLFQSAVDALLSPPGVKFLAINFGEEVTKKYERNLKEHEFTTPSPFRNFPILGRFVDKRPRRQLIKDTHAIATDFSDRVGFRAALKEEDVKDVDIIVFYHNAYRWLFMMAKLTRYYKTLQRRKRYKVRLDLAVAEEVLQNLFDVLTPGGLLVFDDPRPPEKRPNAVELVADMRESNLLDFERSWLLARGDYPVLIVQKPLK